MAPTDLDVVVRDRLRTLRRSMGWSLDDLGVRANLGASTISRIETGKRAISLDVLVPLARALQVDLESLLDSGIPDADVVIRPVPSHRDGATMWPLSRPTGTTSAMKLRLTPPARPSEPRVHPGQDWFYVLEGRIRLQLGPREIIVEAGEAAEFTTMTPHAIDAIEAPAEVLMVFDREGQRVHLHTDS